MHDAFVFAFREAFTTLMLQAMFFISAYHAYFALETLWMCAGALAVIHWLTGTIGEWQIIVGGSVLGLVLSWLTVRVLHSPPPHEFNYNQVYYLVLQPAFLYVFLPRFVVQTSYPVGVVLAFIVWLGGNLVMWSLDLAKREQPLLYYGLLCAPIGLLFLLSFVLHKEVWLPVGIVSGVHAATLLVLALLSASGKKRSAI